MAGVAWRAAVRGAYGAADYASTALIVSVFAFKVRPLAISYAFIS